MTDKIEISAVDLFCGIGGLTHGLIKEGIRVRAGFDIDPGCKFAYEENNSAQFRNVDVGGLNGYEVGSYFEQDKIRLLAGCAPCQPFSSYSNRYRRDDANATHATDSRHDVTSGNWKLLRSFLRLAKEVNPELITMENVVLLQKHEIFEEFVNGLKDLGYHVTYFTVRCSEYGIPQKRKRLVLFASIYGPVSLCKPFSKMPKTVKAWIGSLPAIQAGSTDKKDPLHRAGGLTPLNLRRIQASKPGGTWRDWEDDLITRCHKKERGRSYSPVYGRMDWDIGPTITTQFFTYGTGRFGHPVQDRAISLREGALLQTFPKSYKIVQDASNIRFTEVGRWIGNAVPVNLGRAIGRSLREHLGKHADRVKNG